ncbi:MAG: hypothetical protein QOJ46_1057 [bacterium]
MVDPQRLEYLRSTLYKVTPFRAEDLEPRELEENGWYVDVFRPSADGSPVDDPILDIVDRIAWSDLALSYRSAGRTGEAIELQERVVADRERILGAEHPATIAARDMLAVWRADEDAGAAAPG